MTGLNRQRPIASGFLGAGGHVTLLTRGEDLEHVLFRGVVAFVAGVGDEAGEVDVDLASISESTRSKA